MRQLEKGSGGTVYLVKDLHCLNPEEFSPFARQAADSTPDEVVLKIFQGESEMHFFEREFLSLTVLREKSGGHYPGFIRMLDSQRVPAQQHQCRRV